MKAAWQAMAVALVVVGSSWRVSAQPAASPAEGPGNGSIASGPAESPGFVAIDRLDATSRAGIDVTYLGPHNDIFTDKAILFRVAAQARYVDPASGLGGYVRMPFAFASTTSSSITDLGDVELGGIFAPKFGVPGLGIVLHAGVTLPTGESGENERVVGLAEALLALPDVYNSLPRATTIKLGVSPMIRIGAMFARIDLGLDLNVDAKDTTIGNGIHYNAGIGVELGRTAVMLESENLSILDKHVANGVYRGTTLNALALSARVSAGAVSPYFAVLIPLDDNTTKLFSIAATGGAEIRM